jgi:hypothetical protein
MSYTLTYSVALTGRTHLTLFESCCDGSAVNC